MKRVKSPALHLADYTHTVSSAVFNQSGGLILQAGRWEFTRRFPGPVRYSRYLGTAVCWECRDPMSLSHKAVLLQAWLTVGESSGSSVYFTHTTSDFSPSYRESILPVI